MITFTFAAAMSTVTHAQQSTTTLTGEWVGNSEHQGRSEFLRFSLTENDPRITRNALHQFTIYHLPSMRLYGIPSTSPWTGAAIIA